MKIVAYESNLIDGQVQILESTGATITSNDKEKILGFLCEPYDDPIKVCWELDVFIAPILKLLNSQALTDLAKTKRCHLPPFSLFYVPGKVFSVEHIPSKLKANIYGLDQYFPDFDEVPNVSNLVALCSELMEVLEAMDMKSARKLTSPVAICADSILKKIDMPTLKDIKPEIAELAYMTSARLWIEAHQIGLFENTFDYDLNSAFPSMAMRMLDFRDCQLVECANINPRHPNITESVYGYASCNLTINPDVYVSPILADYNNKLVSHTGTVKNYPITKSQIEFIDKFNLGNVEILHGYFLHNKTKKELSKPLYTPIKKLLGYKARTGTRQYLFKLLAKRMSTGIYGKMGEDYGESFGNYFNPVWFSEISTQTALNVAAFLYTFGIGPTAGPKYDTLLNITVDGIKLSEPLNLSPGDKWKYVEEGETLIISSGLVYTQKSKPKGLKLQDIKDMIQEHPNKGYYTKTLKRRLTLKEAVSMNRLEDIGKYINFNSSINLANLDPDRKFKKLPKTGKQLLTNHYKSQPINLNI